MKAENIREAIKLVGKVTADRDGLVLVAGERVFQLDEPERLKLGQVLTVSVRPVVRQIYIETEQGDGEPNEWDEDEDEPAEPELVAQDIDPDQLTSNWVEPDGESIKHCIVLAWMPTADGKGIEKQPSELTLAAGKALVLKWWGRQAE